MNWKAMCIELWGERWKSTLARTVGCTKRAVQYWSSGERNIPNDVVAKISRTYDIWK